MHRNTSGPISELCFKDSSKSEIEDTKILSPYPIYLETPFSTLIIFYFFFRKIERREKHQHLGLVSRTLHGPSYAKQRNHYRWAWTFCKYFEPNTSRKLSMLSSVKPHPMWLHEMQNRNEHSQSFSQRPIRRDSGGPNWRYLKIKDTDCLTLAEISHFLPIIYHHVYSKESEDIDFRSRQRIQTPTKRASHPRFHKAERSNGWDADRMPLRHADD